MNFNDMKKIVGKVTEAEKNEIQALFERRNGLNASTFVNSFISEFIDLLIPSPEESVQIDTNSIRHIKDIDINVVLILLLI